MYNAFPDEIKEVIRDIAKDERKSMNWVMEQITVRFFKLDKPEYMEIKKNETDKIARKSTNRNRSSNRHR